MKYKRIFAAVTAFSLLLCGCQTTEQPEDSGTVQETLATEETRAVTPLAEDPLTTTAKRQKITMPEMIGMYDHPEPTENGFRVFSQDDDKVMHLYEFDTDFTPTSDRMFVPPASHDGYYYCGGLYAIGETAYYSLAVLENHSNMEPYKEGMEDYDWDAYHGAWESEYLLCSYAQDGTLTEKVTIEGLEDYRQSQGYDQFSQLYAGDGVFWLLLWDGRILKITPDGALEEAYVPEMEGEDHVHRSSIVHDRDGKPVYAMQISGASPSDGSSTSKLALCEFDPGTGRVSEPFSVIVEEYWKGFDPSVYSGGGGDYRLFVSTEISLFGIRDDGTLEEVVSWEDSDLSRLEVIPMPDGSFRGYSMYNGDNNWYHLTRMTLSETKQEKKEITLGVLGEGEGIADFVREFNGSQNAFRVKIVRYRNSDGSYIGDENGANDALRNFKLDIISGDAPDIIVMYNSHESMMQLGRRGAFLDLYELMEGDAEVNRDTVLPNICTAMESENGALYSLPQQFNVATIAVKSRYCDKENWTVDDMIALYDGATDKQFQWMSQAQALEMLLYGTDFVDFTEGTCSFDSPDFLKILEFCSRYPESADPPPKNYDDPAAMEKHQNYYYNKYMRYKRDEDYLCAFELVGERGLAVGQYSYTRYNDLGEEMTLVGYPSDNGEGGKLTFRGELAISSACENREEAWKFVKAMLTGDGDINDNGYPVVEELFETKLDDEMYVMMFGERTDEESLEDDGTVYPLTQEERDDLEEYIRSCDTVLSMNDAILNIALEEAGMYFAGDLTAEAAAQRIQSRAEILVSEQS